MTDCKINFTKETDPLAYGIYQDLLETGASCSALDYGYNVTNYAGLYCPKKDARSCVIGKGDGVVEADEVKEYALDNYEQVKYRQIIEGRLGDPLPWVLDDLDPATTFDEEIREKVYAAIDKLREILKAQGSKEGSDEYNEKVAVGLFYLVSLPDADTIKDAGLSTFLARAKDLDSIGLSNFAEYIRIEGGLRVEGGLSEEYTALEALQNKKGECTELAKILFAVLKIAGFNPAFVHVDIRKSLSTDTRIRKRPYGEFHMCIGLDFGGKHRLFDPQFIDPDAGYSSFYPLTLRHYLAADYLNKGVMWRKTATDKAIMFYTRAINIDPNFALAYVNRGFAWTTMGRFDKAIADYTKAIEKDPEFAIAYNNRCEAWKVEDELDKAITDCSSAIYFNPTLAPAYYNRSLALEAKGEFDKAIADIAKAAALDQTIVEDLLITTKKKWQSSEGLKNSASLFQEETGGADISAYEAQFALAYALWEFKKYEEARETFNGNLKYLSFKTKPSKSTTDFFEDMQARMPATMKKDKGVREMLRTLKEKLK